MREAEVEVVETTEMSWPLRPLLLAILGLVAGTIVYFLVGRDWTNSPTTMALTIATFVVVAAGLVGFTLERRAILSAVIFSLIWGAVAALVAYWNGDPAGWDTLAGWRMMSLALAAAIAAPFYQVARDSGSLAFDYRATHDYAWTNVVLWCAAWAFVFIVYLMIALLDQLFRLIGIAWIGDLMRENWFAPIFIGLNFGLGLGLLHEHVGVVRMVQRVVARVLAVLSPVLAVGLVLFLIALPFTGLSALWDATRWPTGTLLTCVIGALILANAVIGNDMEQESRSRVLRWGALALALAMLPLAVVAACATVLRIQQYGLTPERLWAVVFVGVACAYGVAYLLAVAIDRGAWMARVRSLNLWLAGGLCVLALLLATPFVAFQSLSTRDQVARLEHGDVSAEAFDWAALAFDFGKPGRNALQRLAESDKPEIRTAAKDALKWENRWDGVQAQQEAENAATAGEKLRILPTKVALPDSLAEVIGGVWGCARDRGCTLLYTEGADEAFVLPNDCFAAPEQPVEAQSKPESNPRAVLEPAPFYGVGCKGTRLVRTEGGWANVSALDAERGEAQSARLREGFARGDVEIRTVESRQIFVGGEPVGEPFE